MRTRDNALQFTELFKEWAREIIVAAIFASIPEIFIEPVVAKPDRKDSCWGVYRDDGFSAAVTGTRKKSLLVPPCHAPLLAALRAMRWRWHAHVFVKCEILRRDSERLVALLALDVFHKSGYILIRRTYHDGCAPSKK